jgi:PAS domain S-box-containing protein
VTQLAGVGAMAIGAVTLVGWWLGIGSLTYIRSGWRTMKPTTAVLCLVAGAAVVLLGAERASGRAGAAGRARAKGLRTARNLLGAACGALASVALIQQIFGFRLGIDVLLTGRTVGMPLGRTAVSYVLMSTAILAADKVTPRGRSPTQLLALVSASIALIALLGYAFSLPDIHGPVISTIAGGMALQNAFSIFLLSLGLLLARPDVGFVSALTSNHAGGTVARRLILGVLAFTAIALLVIVGHHLGWYEEAAIAPALAFLALVEGGALIVVTAVRLNAYDLRQRTAERLLRESEQYLQQLFGMAPDGIFIADMEGRYTGVNDAGCRLLGLPREEIVGKTIMDFIPPEQVSRLREDRSALLAGGVRTSEFLLRHRSGIYISVEVSAAILPDGRWQGFVRDISERKRAEAALRELERLREEWVSLVAHDLRQPASSILLSAQALARTRAAGTPDKDHKSVERIRSAATRLNRMIDDLLDASRIEAKRLSLSQQVFDLGGLAVAVAESMREAVGPHAMVVTARSGQYAWIDPDRIQQVLINLIGNAAKYGDRETDILVVAETRHDVVEVSVTNEGAGIPADEIPRLFSRFRRTDGASASATPGTGLGLYIAKGLIEAHGGRIWVDSTPGELTTFHFAVPRASPLAHPPLDAGGPHPG